MIGHNLGQFCGMEMDLVFLLSFLGIVQGTLYLITDTIFALCLQSVPWYIPQVAN